MNDNKRYTPTVQGVGFLGVGNHKTWVGGKKAPAYRTWGNILMRCYDPSYSVRNPTYTGCTVAPEWHNFQVFAEWYHAQTICKGWELDKDLIVKGNKVYSAETCSFVPQEINYLLLNQKSRRGDLPQGVSRPHGRYQARIRVRGKSQHIGNFSTPAAAFEAYKGVKEAHVKDMANFWKPELDPRVYATLMAYTVTADD